MLMLDPAGVAEPGHQGISKVGDLPMGGNIPINGVDIPLLRLCWLGDSRRNYQRSCPRYQRRQ